MSKEVEITLPKLGESIVSATVVRWFKRVGDPIALDEPLLEVSTDKVNSEIPSPVAGILKEIIVAADQEVQVGAILAIVSTERELPSESTKKSDRPTQPTQGSTDLSDVMSPAVLRLMKEHQISLDELDQIPRSGTGNRLTKKDIEDYIANKKTACPYSTKEQSGIERVPMTQFRKAIAQNMVRSFYEAPHASLMTEVDVTDVMGLIQEKKQAFFQEHGVKLSITTFAARALAYAVKEYPLINSSLEKDTILVKKFVNLGVAVSVDHGVMVPVICNCQDLSLSEIGKNIANLALKAREQKLEPQDVKDGTITMTNFGMTGTLIGIPIIRYPEVAIVGLGGIKKRPAVMADDSIAVRSFMWISLTFDHRVLDGLYGCGFLNAVKSQLETNLNINLS